MLGRPFVTPLVIDTVDGSRQVWVQPSTTGRATRCFTFLDAELYRQRVQAPAIVERLQQRDELGATTFAYISSISPEARHRDFTCNPQYASFLASDFVPWIENIYGRFEQHYLGGLSLSGLAAVFAVLRYPSVFAGGLCQSPSAWWDGEWLTTAIPREMSSQGRFWISVGDQELQSDVSHLPTSLYQGASQLASVRRLVERMKETNPTVRANEFCGGPTLIAGRGNSPRH